MCKHGKFLRKRKRYITFKKFPEHKKFQQAQTGALNMEKLQIYGKVLQV